MTKRFGAFVALNRVSFAIRDGTVAGFLGQNGAGKTTTLRILACWWPPTSGRAAVAGFDTVMQSAAVRRVLGYLPESVPLLPELRVREYLRFRARIKGVPSRDVQSAVDEASSRCLITDVLSRPIGALSKGYRQRVGIADAVVHRPKVVILDEPTSGLDPAQRIEVRGLIRSLGADRTVIVSTHILPEVEAACDHVLLLHRGRLVADRPLSELQRGGAVRLTWRGEAAPGARPAGEAGFWTEDVPDADAASRRAAELVRSGAQLRELTPVRESLETVFARLTSGADG